MPYPEFGRHHHYNAVYKNSPKGMQPFINHLTRRPFQLVELSPNRVPVRDLTTANLKSLRLFRHICRLIPFIVRIHELYHRVTPVQSKIYVANWFRQNSDLKNLTQIDLAIKYGYDTVYEAQMNYSNSGYLYRFLIPKTHKMRDFGVDKFYQKKADRINQNTNSKFLGGFYRGYKSHVD